MLEWSLIVNACHRFRTISSRRYVVLQWTELWLRCIINTLTTMYNEKEIKMINTKQWKYFPLYSGRYWTFKLFIILKCTIYIPKELSMFFLSNWNSNTCGNNVFYLISSAKPLKILSKFEITSNRAKYTNIPIPTTIDSQVFNKTWRKGKNDYHHVPIYIYIHKNIYLYMI